MEYQVVHLVINLEVAVLEGELTHVVGSLRVVGVQCFYNLLVLFLSGQLLLVDAAVSVGVNQVEVLVVLQLVGDLLLDHLILLLLLRTVRKVQGVIHQKMGKVQRALTPFFATGLGGMFI